MDYGQKKVEPVELKKDLKNRGAKVTDTKEKLIEGIRAVGAQSNDDSIKQWVSDYLPYVNPAPPHAVQYAQPNYMNDVQHYKEIVNSNNKYFNIEQDEHGPAKLPENIAKDLQMGFDNQATVLIKKLTNVLQILNKNLAKHIKITQNRKLNNAYLVKLPVYAKDDHVRGKRDTEAANNETTAENVAENNATVEIKASEDAANNTDVIPPSVGCNQTLHTRRTFSEDLEVSNAVKSRLLSYIQEYFRDVEKKISALRNVKTVFAADNEYNIGYMIANIDMLEINLKNLKAEMERNRQELGEKHILDMFDKVKVSNNLVTSLLVALKNILERRGKTQETQKFYPVNQNYV